MGELLALTSAVCFGVTDFVSGLLSRRAAGMTVSLYGQLGGTALSLVLAMFWPATGPASAVVWGWAALSGLGTGVGVAFLFRAIGTGPMSVVVPVSALAGAALPVLVALLALGDRPTPAALAGIAVALPAIWLVSRPHETSHDGSEGGITSRHRRSVAGIGDALIAGAGFAVQFLAMAHVDLGSGLWPVVLSRLTSVLIIAMLIIRTGAQWSLPARPAAVAMASGTAGTAAIICYLFASRQQLLSTATVLAALYPAVPVVLALMLLRERLSAAQTAGLLAAAAAASLVAI